MRILAVLVSAYLLGCIVAGYYVVRALGGPDIRVLGSGNAGARNVARTRGRAAAAATLAVDMGKAALAVWLGRALLQDSWGGTLALLGVVVGHVWPVQLGFRGGKGAASAAGGFLAAHAAAALLAVGLGLVVLLAVRRFTAAGLAAVAAAPVALLALGRPWPDVALAALAAAVVLAAHHPSVAGARRAALAGAAR
jgi:glycerol-3-phosphate acyltransferase PlsY